MKSELVGSIYLPMSGKLSSLAQGSDLLILPCMWDSGVQYNNGRIWVFFLTASTVAHAFDFFQNGSVSLGSVTVTAAASGYFSSPFTLPTNGLRGLTDYVSVRHSTNAQNANESSSHVNEGGQILAGLIPEKIR